MYIILISNFNEICLQNIKIPRYKGTVYICTYFRYQISLRMLRFVITKKCYCKYLSRAFAFDICIHVSIIRDITWCSYHRARYVASDGLTWENLLCSPSNKCDGWMDLCIWMSESPTWKIVSMHTDMVPLLGLSNVINANVSSLRFLAFTTQPVAIRFCILHVIRWTENNISASDVAIVYFYYSL